MTFDQLVQILKVDGAHVLLPVHAQPGARKSEIVGIYDGNLKIKIKAPPVEGKANEALIRFLSERAGLPKSHVELVRGDLSRRKILRLRGLSAAQIAQRLLIKI